MFFVATCTVKRLIQTFLTYDFINYVIFWQLELKYQRIEKTNITMVDKNILQRWLTKLCM